MIKLKLRQHPLYAAPCIGLHFFYGDYSRLWRWMG